MRIIAGIIPINVRSKAVATTLAPHNPMGPLDTAVNLHFCASAPNFKILEYKDSQVSAGALFRIGKLYLDFAETLLNADEHWYAHSSLNPFVVLNSCVFSLYAQQSPRDAADALKRGRIRNA